MIYRSTFERDMWEECAAIYEYDAGLSRQEAETRATADVLRMRGLDL